VAEPALAVIDDDGGAVAPGRVLDLLPSKLPGLVRGGSTRAAGAV
jgi:hypothetical protein